MRVLPHLERRALVGWALSFTLACVADNTKEQHSVTATAIWRQTKHAEPNDKLGIIRW
jgi:hypothetical protein